MTEAARDIADGTTSPTTLHVATHELDDAPPPRHSGISDPYVWIDTWMHQAHLAIRWRANERDDYAPDCVGRDHADYGDVHLDEIDGVDQKREAVARAVRARLPGPAHDPHQQQERQRQQAQH